LVFWSTKPHGIGLLAMEEEISVVTAEEAKMVLSFDGAEEVIFWRLAHGHVSEALGEAALCERGAAKTSSSSTSKSLGVHLSLSLGHAFLGGCSLLSLACTSSFFSSSSSSSSEMTCFDAHNGLHLRLFINDLVSEQAASGIWGKCH